MHYTRFRNTFLGQVTDFHSRGCYPTFVFFHEMNAEVSLCIFQYMIFPGEVGDDALYLWEERELSETNIVQLTSQTSKYSEALTWNKKLKTYCFRHEN